MQNAPTVEGNQTDNAQKLTAWANEPTVMTLQEDLQMAGPAQQAHVSKVKGWLELRDAKTLRNSDNRKSRRTRSQVQPKLVRRQAEWRYPALSEPFLSSEKTFQVSPVTWEDVKAAEQNELVLNHQFRTKMNTVAFIDDYVRTVVDEGTVMVKVGWRRETVVETVMVPVWSYYAVTDEQTIQLINEGMQLMNENPQGFEDLPEDQKESVRYSMETGVYALAEQTGETEAEEERIVRNHPTLEILDYGNVYIDPTAGGDMSKANFAIISFETSKAELMKDGRYKNLDQVNWSSNSPLHVPTHISKADNSIQFRDEIRKKVVAYEYWGSYDVNGDGVLKPIVATWIGNTMIRMEENPFPDQQIPIVIARYLPVKDSLTGEPDAELLGDNQAIIGALTRAMIDLMAKAANGQVGTAKGTLDVVNRRKYEAGEDYEFNPGMHPQQAIHHHTFPEIPLSALNMLGMQNQEAEALTGVKAFSGGLSGEAYGELAAGVKGLLDAAGKREMSILRRLAQGMEEIGRKIVAMNGVFLSEEEVVQITNEQFVTVRREDLAGEFNMKVDISTAEIEQAKAQDLGFMLQTLGNTIPWEMTQMILSEIARLKRMPALAHAISKFKPQPDPLAEKLKELEIAKLEAEIQEIRAKSALAQAKAREALATADQKDLDFIEQETGTKHAREKDKLAAQSEANQMLEITKRVLDPAESGNKRTEISDGLKLHALAQAMS